MFKFKQFYLHLFLLTIILAGCKEEESMLPPIISGIEKEYSIFEDETLEISPKVENNFDANFSWIVETKEVSTSLSHKLQFSKAGVYNVIFKATNAGGTATQDFKVIVATKGSAPIITNVEAEYTTTEGEALKIEPTVTSISDVTYKWSVDGKAMSNQPKLDFDTKKPGQYNVLLEVSNRAGISSHAIEVIVNPATKKVEVNLATILKIEMPDFAKNNKNAQWQVVNSASNLYRLSSDHAQQPLFVAAKPGKYTIELSVDKIKASIEVSVLPAPSQLPSPYTAKVFDYLPSPGQFVNKMPTYKEGDTHSDMVKKVENTITGANASMITLGGWGGYVVLGFDHTIVNVAGKRDFRIHGNAFGSLSNTRPNAPFGGSCEPGIIMVAYDKNKNGKPDDDEWYEIKGSANHGAEKEPWYDFAAKNGNDVRTIRDYEMTFYKPEVEDTKPNDKYIRWEDNKGQKGYKVKNAYHKQSYYPLWLSDDKITFKGIRLADNGIDESGKGNNFVLYAFQYGYTDNYPNNHENSAIDIDWAIDKEGKPANLPGIDFVKIIGAVDKENGWLGEASTEVAKGEDLHLLDINIDTIKKETRSKK